MRSTGSNQGIFDSSPMQQPQDDVENALQETPLSKRMPDEGYSGNISNGNAYVTSKDTPFDVTEIEKEMQGLSLQNQIAAENTVLGMSNNATTIWNYYQKLLKTTDTSNKFYRDLPEEDEFLREKFHEIDEAINDSVDDPNFAAYKLARQQNPQYIKNHLFKIGFLRAERYDSDKTAKRILRYLGEKLELFGKDKLTRVIYWTDLGDDVVAYIRRGALQYLPEPDLHGRRVLVSQWLVGDSSDEEIFIARKAYFYFWTTMPETDTEKGKLLGIVAIMWKVHKTEMADPKVMESIRHVWQCSPTKVSCYHICQRWPPTNLVGLKTFAKRFLSWFRNSGDLMLLRSHHGKQKRCTKVLVEEYGCPHDSLNRLTEDPINYKVNIEQWITDRQKIDTDIEILVESIKSLGNSNMTLKQLSVIGPGPMQEKVNSMNSSSNMMNMQSINQRILNEITSEPRMNILESDLSMTPSDLFVSRISRLSSGSFAWMNDDSPADQSLDFILDEVMKVSTKNSGNGTGQSDGNGTGQFKFPSELVTETSGPLEILSEDKENGQDGNRIDNIIMDRIHETAIPERDIKLGRGKPLQRHPGNIWFRNQIRQIFPEYDRSEKARQTQMSLEMVHFVRSENRRFLMAQSKEKGYWREISVAEAREKVAVNFRTERKRVRKIQFPGFH